MKKLADDESLNETNEEENIKTNKLVVIDKNSEKINCTTCFYFSLYFQ